MDEVPKFSVLWNCLNKVEKTGGKEKPTCRLRVTPVARQLAAKNLFTAFVPVFRFARLGLGLPIYFHSTVHAQAHAAPFL